MPAYQDDLEFVARVLAGDEEAAAHFAQTYTRRFEYLARRAGVAWQDCGDVAHNALAKALQRLGQFRGEGQLGAYLRRIIDGEIADYCQERDRARRLLSTTAATPADDSDSDTEIALVETLPAPPRDYDLEYLVREVLQRLPAEHRLILLLKRTLDFTLEEIAQRLELTTGQAAGRLFTAQKMFRRYLELGAEKPAEPLAAPRAKRLAQRRTIGAPVKGAILNERSNSTRTGAKLLRAEAQRIAHRLLFWGYQRIRSLGRRGSFARMRSVLAGGPAVNQCGGRAG